ncbi:hypothetical protein DMJ13_02930 [halophilic archaeon]|nr:hypothetical protein DMJ13_02930 [halophilic archaeon]
MSPRTDRSPKNAAVPGLAAVAGDDGNRRRRSSLAALRRRSAHFLGGGATQKAARLATSSLPVLSGRRGRPSSTAVPG